MPTNLGSTTPTSRNTHFDSKAKKSTAQETMKKLFYWACKAERGDISHHDQTSLFLRFFTEKKHVQAETICRSEHHLLVKN